MHAPAHARTTGPAARERTTHAGGGHPLLALQRAIGNRATARLARQVASPAVAAPPLRRGDRGEDVERLQLALNRHLGVMNRDLLEVDGRFGRLTAGAVRAVRRLHGERNPSSEVDAGFWETLRRDPPPDAAAHTGAGPEYDRMLADGLLDITYVNGFDEEGGEVHEIAEVRRGLTEMRGFVHDDALGRRVLAAAGRPRPLPGSELFVRQGVRIGTRTVSVVVRMIAPPQDDRDPLTGGRRADADETSRRLRAAALEGMNRSDVFLYSGHARYGAGPDLDRNWTVAVDWSRMPYARPHGALDEYTETEEEQMVRDLRLGGTGATGARRMRALISGADPAVRVIGHSAGNIGVTPGASLYQNELGGVLIGEATRGQEQPLASSVTEDRYRLWIFNACNTRVYERSIRGTGNARLGEEHLDTIQTRDEGPVVMGAETVLTMIDGLLAMDSERGLARRMNRADDLDIQMAQTRGFDVTAP